MKFFHSIDVERLTQSSGQSVYSSWLTDAEAFVQPLDTESTESLGESFSKGSFMYLPIGTDVQEGDRVTFDGDVYKVKGIKPYKYGNLAHQKALIEQL